MGILRRTISIFFPLLHIFARLMSFFSFAHLVGIHRLSIWGCNQAIITDAAFEYLKGIHSLVMESCTQDTITGAGLEHLKGISRLGMDGCTDEAIAVAESLGLPVARREYTHYGAFDTSFVELE